MDLSEESHEAVDQAEILDRLREIYEIIAPNFSRAEPRRRAWRYLCGLAGAYAAPGDQRRNAAADHRERRPDGAQRLLTTAQWDEERIRADVRDLVQRHFGRAGGELHVVEMTFVKKGSDAVAVDRQYSVDTRRLENCQIALLMFYEPPGGAMMFLDADLYLPASWAGDRERRQKAGIPAALRYRTKAEIATTMVERALAAGLDPKQADFSFLCPDKMVLRRALLEREVPYLVRLNSAEFSGLAGTLGDIGRGRLVEQVVPHAVIGRSVVPTSYCCVGGRRAVSSGELRRMVLDQQRREARARSLRSEIGLDRFNVRSWRGWHRHMTLAMVVQAATALAQYPPQQP